MAIVNLDFEWFSMCGTRYDLGGQKFTSEAGTGKAGLPLVGAYRGAGHPSTEVLVARYTFNGGETLHTWVPGIHDPRPLLDHVAGGGLVQAWNSFFEWCVWNRVCVPKYGWPPLPLGQTRDTMAAAYAFSLPGSLAGASAVMFGRSEKDLTATSIMRRLSRPRNPTKGDRRLRYDRHAPKTQKETEEWARLDAYCGDDVRAESHLAAVIPELTPSELDVWLLDQKINARGILVDMPLVDACLNIISQGKLRAGIRLTELTGGTVTKVSQATAIIKWVNDPRLETLEPEEKRGLQEYLDNCDPPPHVREVLTVRKEIGGNAPAKLVAMKFQASDEDGRVRGAYQYSGASRTRRWAGRAVQTQNMVKGGPKVFKCTSCNSIQKKDMLCKVCGVPYPKVLEWGIEGVEAVIPALSTGDYDRVNDQWGNPVRVVSGCLRSLLVAAPGYKYVSSDFSAIEAVVMACMAGESWIVDVFRGDGRLYEQTGSKITGVPLGEIDGKHYARSVGKVASLAFQFQGARGAALKFGAGKFLSNKEIDEGVRAWRKAAPNMVFYWGALEEGAFRALLRPGTYVPVLRANGEHTGVTFCQKGRALFCVLPCGEWLTYLDPKVSKVKKLSRKGWDICARYESYLETGDSVCIEDIQRLTGATPEISGPLFQGPSPLENEALKTLLIRKGYVEWKDALAYSGYQNHTWKSISTYGGKLAENVTQATARFILSNAMLNVEAAGYPIVMHTHDEIVSEVPKSFGSVLEFESIMSRMPIWAQDWPVRAKGGWEGKRYRK